MIKLFVSGSRKINSAAFVFSVLDDVAKRAGEDIFLIVGDALGVDSMALAWAKKRGFGFKVYKAKWETVGEGMAGFDRNTDMVEDCEAAVFLWDGKSNGTKDAMNKVRVAKIQHEVHIAPEWAITKPKPEIGNTFQVVKV